MSAQVLTFDLPYEADTFALAAGFAKLLRAGDTLLLSGPIGAGKSAFARGVIRARLGQNIDVPSPTFTLVQTYEDQATEMWHCDFYRLTHPDDVFELGLDEALGKAICLIEWPDRLGQDWPEDALHLTFAANESGHRVAISANDAWTGRLDHLNDR